MRKSKRLAAAAAAASLITLPGAPLGASGTWNGQDTLHVPVSWCVVTGSPAQANPNVAGDTVTDDVIWRRHERPTDGIFINQAGITFRSSINNAWTVLDFPQIADPDTALATAGDVRGEDPNVNGVEFNALLNACDTAYNGLGRAGIGITAVNVGLFHDGGGTYVGIGGWGGCTESVATGLCVAPYDGFAMLVDNHYMHPSVPNRTFPGTGTQFTLTDPLDQVTGHEFGHALSLAHRNLATALMNPGSTDNNADGQTDNVALDAAEVTALRTTAAIVPGLEIDPPNRIVPGDFVATRVPTRVRETGQRAHLDLAALKVTYDTRKERVFFGDQLFGLLPKDGAAGEHWLLVDANGDGRGATAAALREAGVPATRFRGADLVIRMTPEGRKLTGAVWQLKQDRLVRLDTGFDFDLRALVMYPHYLSIIEKDKRGVPVHHVFSVGIDNRIAGLALKRPLRVQALVATAGKRVVDRLDATPAEKGVEVVLERPSFPHCFPQGEAPPGGTVKVVLEGLKPDAPAHVLLGPRLVHKTQTDAKGGGTFDLPIPRDEKPGLHLLTVGNERTALTADCPVKVTGGAQ